MIKKYITKQSSIKGAGKGLFTNASFKKGELIGLAHVDDQPASEIGRNHNHNEKNPTANNIKNGNKRYLIASRNLKPGEEITTNYRMQPELEQPEDFMRKGGSVLKMPNKKNSKGYSRSLSATNKLFTQNFLFEKPKSRKNKVFDPNSKYYAEGGSLLTKKVTCKSCGWKWDAEDGGKDITTCHKCGSQGLVHAQGGGEQSCPEGYIYYNGQCVEWQEPEVIETDENTGYNAATGEISRDTRPGSIENNDWWKEHEDFHHLQNLAGSMNTAGFLSQRPNNTAASDQAIDDYYNRRNAELEAQTDAMIKADPNLQFIPRNKLQDFTEGFVGANALMYQDPTTVEGEARVREQQFEEDGKSIFPKKQGGGNTDAMTGMMKARLAYANEFGNPAAERMINLPDNPYQFDNGDTGSHYMASMDNYAVPQIQDENGVLQLKDYGPESNEAIRFDSDEDANYFAENYKNVSPGFINEKQYGGLNKFVDGGKVCPKGEYWNGKKCVKLPKNAFVTSDLKKYIQRKAAYDDSLNHHKAYLFQDALTPGHYKINNNVWKYETGKDKGWATEKAMFDDITGLGPCPSNRPDCWDKEKKAIKYYKSLGFTDKDIQYHTTPDIVTNRMKPSGSYSDYPNGFRNPIYKKPVQEVIFDEPQKIITEKKIIKPTTRTVYVDCPSGSVSNGQIKDVTTPDPESPGNYLRTITTGCELEKIENLPILKPGLIKQQNYELQGADAYMESLEPSDEENEDEESAIEEYKTGKIKSETDRRINWRGTEVPYRLLGWRFRQPENWDKGLINTKLKGKKRYAHLPTIEKRKNTYILDSDGNKKYITINDYKQYGGISNDYIETDLDEDEIEEYRRGGYIVEEIDNYQDGGVYTVKGSKGAYKKVNGKWQVDWNKSGKYQPLSKGDIKARTAVLDKMAKPVDNGISKVSSNSSDNTRVNYQKPLVESFNRSNNLESFYKKEREKDLQKQKDATAYHDKTQKVKQNQSFGEFINQDVLGIPTLEEQTKQVTNDKKLLKKELKPYFETEKEIDQFISQQYSRPTASAENNWNDGPIQLVYPEKYGIGPGGGMIGNIKNLGINTFNLGKKVLSNPYVSGGLNAYFGYHGINEFSDPNSLTRKSMSRVYDDPTGSNIGDAAWDVSMNSLNFVGLPFGKFIKGSKNLINNTYKINPWAFKPDPSKFYRQIGNAGLEDAVSSKIIRSADQSTFPRPYFVEGKDFEKLYSTGSGAHGRPNVIFETPGITNEGLPFVSPANASADYTPWIANMAEVPLTEGRLLKQNWLKGYKEVPKQLPGSPNAFKSEINWNNWNKEIPNNPELMKEYNTIEQQTKANGTWMKNPDGSTFQGTPEQFVQQNSENFKKAFGNSKLVNPDGSPWILEHGSPKKFDTFDESKFQLGDAGYSGSGIYTVPPKGSADSYTISGRRFHTGDIEPTTYKLYGQGNNPITSEELIKLGTNSPAGKEMDLFNFHRKSAPLNEQLLNYDVAIHNQNRGIAKVRDLDDAWEVVFPTNKQLKSAVGNNGMFDMTNPNIYKSVLPIGLGLGLGATQYKQGGSTNDYVDVDLTPEEIKDLIAQGYVIEELN